MRIRKELTLVESPRDAWQGIKHFIPTNIKADYINTLLKVGFDIIEVGSIVSEKAIPQLSDTIELLNLLEQPENKTRMMILTANEAAAQKAAQFDSVGYLSYPHSISPTFLSLNLRRKITESLQTIEQIHEVCHRSRKELIVYIAMAFGNPYGDPWNQEMIYECVDHLIKTGISKITLTDVTGNAVAEDIEYIFDHLYYEFRNINFGFHLHAGFDWQKKIGAAYSNRCRTYDSVILGAGGCPMTGKELLGNVDTIKLLAYFQQCGEEFPSIDFEVLAEAEKMAKSIFME